MSNAELGVQVAQVSFPTVLPSETPMLSVGAGA